MQLACSCCLETNRPRLRGLVVAKQVLWNAMFGLVVEWLCSGLQIRVRRFNSGPGLHIARCSSRILSAGSQAGGSARNSELVV